MGIMYLERFIVATPHYKDLRFEDIRFEDIMLETATIDDKLMKKSLDSKINVYLFNFFLNSKKSFSADLFFLIVLVKMRDEK